MVKCIGTINNYLLKIIKTQKQRHKNMYMDAF